ncbi:hypothetical protein K431DRAFT_283909 [Polychaeton citri CBS 116435]|uniref:DUF7924 domain-containing protein n=1 Tax=Polychaeton citri CBS 116435 TaxID=1314669 RepID=A0A9P4QD57_9PEZI|nr:hypothetical protein K431DRAFT_283909 [Polychaeton citri CBS 116435]
MGHGVRGSSPPRPSQPSNAGVKRVHEDTTKAPRKNARLESSYRNTCTDSQEKPTYQPQHSLSPILPKEEEETKTSSLRKQKRPQKSGISAIHRKDKPPKHPPLLRPEAAADGIDLHATSNDRVGHWIRHQRWPKRCFESDKSTQLYSTRETRIQSWDHERRPLDMPREVINYFAVSKSATSLRQSGSGAGSTTPSTQAQSGQGSKKEKGIEYKSRKYVGLLANVKVHMAPNQRGPSDKANQLLNDLQKGSQNIPDRSRVSDDIFSHTCRRLARPRNEAKLVQDVSRLLVPSAEELADFGAEHLKLLVESVNEGWDSAKNLIGSRPQPDYAVGFDKSAFTSTQIARLSPFVGHPTADYSFFMATSYMYFPFLTCEAKRSGEDVEIANRQNAHSMAIAVRAVVMLFHYLKLEEELDREILGFSVSHNDRSAVIYAHYPTINGSEINYFRHEVNTIEYAMSLGDDRWKTYKFIRNVYDTWMPMHLQRLRSAIDQIPPDINLEATRPELRPSAASGLSQYMNAYDVQSSSEVSGPSGAGEAQNSSGTSQHPSTTFTTSVVNDRPAKRQRPRPSSSHHQSI